MKKILFGLISLSLFFTACNKDEIDPLGVIYEGYVYDTKTGEPIADANLVITVNGESKTETTDANGYYAFEKISSGVYPLAISKDGYLSESTYVGNNVSSNSATEEIVINSEYELSPLSESLGLTVFIAKNYNATKIAAANVSFTYKFGYDGDQWNSGTTDENGLVSLDEVPFNTSVYIFFDFTVDGVQYKENTSIYNSTNSLTIYPYSEGSLGIVSSNIVESDGGEASDFSIAEDITIKFTQSVDTANVNIGFGPDFDISWTESNTKLTIDPTDDLTNDYRYYLYLELTSEDGSSSYNEYLYFRTEE